VAHGARELDAIFDAHHSLVFRTAYRITGNAADAEDVLQTVFLRLLRRDRASGALEAPESYLRRAAINVALDLVRSGRQRQGVPLEDVPGLQADAEPRELRQALIRALARLSSREAEIFALRFFEDQPNKQIASLLGISQVHVAVILHRARTQIRAELDEASSARRDTKRELRSGSSELAKGGTR
jgi:RNA polymerase sigma-70 factor (ECF subfamily)